MSARTTLKQLFPVELTGAHAQDLALDALHLDAAKVTAESMVPEIFPDTTVSLLADWERVCGLSPGSTAPLRYRRAQVVRKIRERGGLSIPYFVQLAAELGYAISIIEPVPFMAGLGRAGEAIVEALICYQWGVLMPSQPLYHFRAGSSVSGERLLWWNPQTMLEDLFRELKPAHTFVYFSYSE